MLLLLGTEMREHPRENQRNTGNQIPVFISPVYQVNLTGLIFQLQSKKGITLLITFPLKLRLQFSAVGLKLNNKFTEKMKLVF